MRITTRAEWGARAPKAVTPVAPGRRAYFVVHYSGAPATQTVRAIQDWCMDEPPHGRGFSDIDYNFLVRGTTGEIYEGRGWDVVGSHTTNYNTVGIGVCVISDGPISDKAKAAVRWLYDQANARCHKKLIIKGHRDLATTGTDCPGDHMYAWVHAGMPAPAQEDDEMDDATIKKLSDAIASKTAVAVVNELLSRDLGRAGGGDTVGMVLQTGVLGNGVKALAALEQIAENTTPPSTTFA